MIYLLEDDESIVKFVIYALNQTGFEAQGFLKPSEFKMAVENKMPELCLLDIMLTEEDGISVLKWLRSRAETAELPVIMLTAKASEYDKVAGLDSGADDYIAKPFGTMELISRIKALLRRTKTADKVYCAGDVILNPKSHTVTAKGEAVALTLKEFEMLRLMPKQVHSTERADTAADCSSTDQRFLGNSPSAPFCFLLVRKHKEQSCRID